MNTTIIKLTQNNKEDFMKDLDTSIESLRFLKHITPAIEEKCDKIPFSSKGCADNFVIEADKLEFAKNCIRNSARMMTPFIDFNSIEITEDEKGNVIVNGNFYRPKIG